MSEAMPSLSEVEAASRERGLGSGASELHGALCGWLAGGGEGGPDWPARVLADEGLAAVGREVARSDLQPVEHCAYSRSATSTPSAFTSLLSVTSVSPGAKPEVTINRSDGQSIYWTTRSTALPFSMR